MPELDYEEIHEARARQLPCLDAFDKHTKQRAEPAAKEGPFSVFERRVQYRGRSHKVNRIEPHSWRLCVEVEIQGRPSEKQEDAEGIEKIEPGAAEDQPAAEHPDEPNSLAGEDPSVDAVDALGSG